MLVDQDTVVKLERADRAGRRIFVAGCTERMAPIFTGVRGMHHERALDVERYVGALDALWDAAEPEAFKGHFEEIERFEEFEDPEDDDVSDIGDVYAFYAALTLRYALSCVTSSDLESAVKCGHVALTAMGQFDQAAPSASFMQDERRYQARTDYDVGSASSLEKFRQECRESARARFETLRRRI
ncbi:DUF416 family protein [Dactylosporangium sp. NPDC005555]|uniref:DUF416 family protein n=1 Tax=Dactylosporangium sp. NPDC005555 TaxID=3154889 RepID=UPI0033B005FA